MMRPGMEAMIAWLIDYYAMATVVLVGAIVIMSRMRQPARRLAIGRSAAVGVAMLAVLMALPGWPRTQWRGLPGVILPERASVSVVPVVSSGLVVPAHVVDESGFSDAAAGERRAAAVEGQIGPQRVMPDLGAWGSVQTAEIPANCLEFAAEAFVAGAALMLAWLGIGFWQVGEMRRQSRPAPGWSQDLLAGGVGEGRRTPRLLVSD